MKGCGNMFEFFIALFGGTSWGAKILSDKNAVKSADKRIAKTEAAYSAGSDTWKHHVVDLELENQITRRLSDDTGYLNRCKRKMQEELGEMYLPMIGYPSYSSTTVRYLLAKQGKLKSDDASSYGLTVVGANQGSSFETQRWEKEVYFIKWMHNELVKHHGDNASELMFRSRHLDGVHEVPLNNMPKYGGGEIYWAASSYSTYRDRISAETRENDAKIEDAAGVFAGILILLVAIIISVLAIKDCF